MAQFSTKALYNQKRFFIQNFKFWWFLNPITIMGSGGGPTPSPVVFNLKMAYTRKLKLLHFFNFIVKWTNLATLFLYDGITLPYLNSKDKITGRGEPTSNLYYTKYPNISSILQYSEFLWHFTNNFYLLRRQLGFIINYNNFKKSRIFKNK